MVITRLSVVDSVSTGDSWASLDILDQNGAISMIEIRASLVSGGMLTLIIIYESFKDH